MKSALFVSETIVEEYGDQISAILSEAPKPMDLLVFRPHEDYSADQLARIEAAFYSRDIWQGTVRNCLSPAAQAFWRYVDRAANLKWLQVLSAGMDQQAYQTSIQRGIQITTSSGTNAEPVGLTAVTGLLMLARGFPHWIKSQQMRQWAPIAPERAAHDLKGQTALIIGTGSIGMVIARVLQAVGLRTVGVRRKADAVQFFDEIHALEDLDHLLPSADWLILACPLTKATRGLISARRLALLPRGAGVVNIARGEILDEEALIDALRREHFMGAYLDVFHEEPLPVSSPLWTLPNVIVTPHNSAMSAGNYQRSVERFLANLSAYLHGKPMTSVAMPE